jgi:hypothetical protein
MAIDKTSNPERSWGDVFDVIDRVIDDIDAGGATVPEATELAFGTVKQAALQPDAAGANPTKAEYDALLAALVAAGIMAAS